MKKLVTSVVTFALVLSTAVAVSAAPNVNGSVTYGIDKDNDGLQGVINFDGQLSPSLDYHTQLKSAMDTDPNSTDNMSTSDKLLGNENLQDITLKGASFTYKNKLADVTVGKFAYNPTVMTIMDTSTYEMNAPLAVKIAPKVGKNIDLAFGFQPRQDSNDPAFGDNAYQVEAGYNFGIASVGVNYQKLDSDHDGALVWQASAQPLKNLNVYGEVGKENGDAYNDQKDVAKIGALFTMDKFYARGEYNDKATDLESKWATRIGYNFTNNLSAEVRSWAKSENKVYDQYNQVRVNYNF